MKVRRLIVSVALSVAVLAILVPGVAHARTSCVGAMCATTYCISSCSRVGASDNARSGSVFREGSRIYFYRGTTYLGSFNCAGRRYCDANFPTGSTGSCSTRKVRHVLFDGTNRMDRTLDAC